MPGVYRVSASCVTLGSAIHLTTQTKMSLSFHEALRGNRAFEAALEKKTMAKKEAKDNAEVALKIWVSCWSLIVGERNRIQSEW